jgi:periplasmic divalent cation tolerance protein
VTERVVALSTVGTAEDAERLARALVEKRLAACVNIIPGLVSIYRWRGAVEREALVSLHPYEVPELLTLPVEDGHPPYLSWLDESVASV